MIVDPRQESNGNEHPGQVPVGTTLHETLKNRMRPGDTHFVLARGAIGQTVYPQVRRVLRARTHGMAERERLGRAQLHDAETIWRYLANPHGPSA